MRKGLVLGIVGALVVGAAEVAAEAAVEASAAEASSGFDSLALPAGAVGDQVAYARFVRAAQEAEWLQAGGRTFRVDSVLSHLDDGSVARDVVHYFYNTSYPIIPSNGLPVLGPEWRWDVQAGYGEYLDLATRDRIGSWFQAKVVKRYAFVGQAHDDQGFHSYGPDPVNKEFAPPGTHRKEPLFLHAGRTRTSGEPATDWGTARLAAELSHPSGWGAVSWDELTYEYRVGTPAEIDGRRALPLQLEGCVRWQVEDDPWWGDNENRVPFFEIEIPVPARVCFQFSEWIADGRPYPVRMETRLVVNGTQSLWALETMTSYLPGDTPIPWGEYRDGQEYRDFNPDLTRSPTAQRYPADGAGADLAYPLSAVVAAVDGDPTLARFNLWQLQNPSAILAGARLEPIQPAGHGLVWNLVYATPAGKAFVVASEKAASSSAPTNSEVGEMRSPPFTLDDFPPGPVTVGAVAELWKREGGGERLEANYLQWGFRYRPPTVHCWRSDVCKNEPADIRIMNGGLRTLYFGHAFEPQPTGHTYVIPPPWLQMFNCFVVDPTTGKLIVSVDFARDYAAPSLPPVQAEPGPPPQALAAPSSVQAIDYSRGAVLTGSLLALVLAIYFYPIIKFLGAQAVLLLPGYAKIHKSQLLNNKLRENMIHAIRSDPGATPTQLQALTGAGWSTIVYHLSVLERNGLVSSMIDGRQRRYFPVDAVNWSDRGRIAALKNARTRELYELLADEPGLDRVHVARRLGISRPATYWHLDRLEKSGLVGRDQDGRRVRFFAMEDGPLLPSYNPRDAVEVT